MDILEGLKRLKKSYCDASNGIQTITTNFGKFTFVNGTDSISDLELANSIYIANSSQSTVNFRSAEGFQHLSKNDFDVLFSAVLSRAGEMWDMLEARCEEIENATTNEQIEAVLARGW